MSSRLERHWIPKKTFFVPMGFGTAYRGGNTIIRDESGSDISHMSGFDLLFLPHMFELDCCHVGHLSD